ncbi:MAG: hypothetical protein DWQ05_17915 [Calditrichaeota bacterium]|nr:MAG: hypothetical protein DWQ05_17915 [Calditrichota bacterium]
MRKTGFTSVAILITILFLLNFAQAQKIDITNASILISNKIKSPVRATLIKILQEEISNRTSVAWHTAKNWDSGKNAIIAIALSRDKKLFGKTIPQRNKSGDAEYKPEGYRIFTQKKDGKNIVWILGADARGCLFGVGHILRTAVLLDKKAYLSQPLDLATSPMQSIRGHQLGYRNTANSYDAWDVAQYEKYIRELALFGTNAIENIPFGPDDSPHMPIPREKMNIEMSKICAAYDLDYWVWTPATFDLKDNEKRTAMLKTHEAFYKACPKLDQIFFPGGDPGHNHPREVMPFLHDLSKLLKKHHPKAGMWISLQGFSAEQIDYFYTYLDEFKPDWLRGVVSGPSSPSIAGTRHRLPAQYRHRHYPDITHNLRCDYPAINWDQAYMLTIGREGINPQPNYYAKIHATYAPFTDGFVAYSDGAHDDVNKVVWSMRSWDIEKNVRDIMIDYCRFFFGDQVAEKAADGIFGLEHNWVGPIIENGSIETTFEYWQKLEKENPQLAGNWRWQMLVLRAYYDTYQRRRKIYETGLEKEANAILAKAQSIGADKALDKALAIVNKADSEPVAQDLHTKIVQYFDDLFHSIGLQTDVEKYKASGAQRGCMLQFVNYPLNNRWWLVDESKKIKALATEKEKLARLKIIHTWENPGDGSYYDNVSNIETGRRVLTTQYDACDVAWWDGGYSRERLSSQLFQWEPVLEYENLDFNGRYIIRVCGQGDALIRVDGERLEPVLYNKDRGEFKEFVVPKHITQDGKMRVSFDKPEESHLRWTKFSHISDVWVIKR